MATSTGNPRKPPMGEQGTAADPTRLFSSFDGGRSLLPDSASARDYDTMLRSDGKARTLEQVLTLPLRSATWSIEPGKGDQGEAEFVTEVLTQPANAGGMSTPLELVLGQMTAASIYRKAFFEKVYRADGLRVVLDKIAYRPPATCEIRRDATDGSFQGYWQDVPRGHPGADGLGRILISPERAFVFIHGQHRDPLDGTSDFEIAYTAWKTKQKIFFLWYQFLENQSLPKIAATTSGNDDGQLSELVAAVAGLKSAGVVGLKAGESLTPIGTDGRGADQFKQAIEFLNSEAAGSVLAGFTDLTGAAAAGRGSFALSKDQTDLFLQSRQAVAREMGTSFTSWVIADLIEYNLGVGRSVPRLTCGPLVMEDIDQALALLEGLAGTPTATTLPREFVDELIVRVAGYLGMDVDKIAKAVQAAQDQAASTSDTGATPVGQLAAAVDTTAGAVAALSGAAA